MDFNWRPVPVAARPAAEAVTLRPVAAATQTRPPGRAARATLASLRPGAAGCRRGAGNARLVTARAQTSRAAPAARGLSPGQGAGSEGGGVVYEWWLGQHALGGGTRRQRYVAGCRQRYHDARLSGRASGRRRMRRRCAPVRYQPRQPLSRTTHLSRAPTGRSRPRSSASQSLRRRRPGSCGGSRPGRRGRCRRSRPSPATVSACPSGRRCEAEQARGCVMTTSRRTPQGVPGRTPQRGTACGSSRLESSNPALNEHRSQPLLWRRALPNAAGGRKATHLHCLPLGGAHEAIRYGGRRVVAVRGRRHCDRAVRAAAYNLRCCAPGNTAGANRLRARVGATARLRNRSLKCGA